MPLRMARHIEHLNSVTAEVKAVAISHQKINAGYSFGVSLGADDLAMPLRLQGQITARMIKVVMSVEYVGQGPTLALERRIQRFNFRCVDGSGHIGLTVVNQIAVVV